jgi:hypothetical protein
MEEITDKILLELGFSKKSFGVCLMFYDYSKDGFIVHNYYSGEQFPVYFYGIIKDKKWIIIKYINELKEEYLKHTGKILV